MGDDFPMPQNKAVTIVVKVKAGYVQVCKLSAPGYYHEARGNGDGVEIYRDTRFFAGTLSINCWHIVNGENVERANITNASPWYRLPNSTQMQAEVIATDIPGNPNRGENTHVWLNYFL